jgi:hypothetical protein
MGANHELGPHQLYPSKDLLIVQTWIAHEALLLLRKHRMGRADSSVEFPILTDEIERVGKPVGVANSGYQRIDHSGRNRRIVLSQASLAKW